MATDPRQINIKDFVYELPDEKIAKYPLPDRAGSKLLHYQAGQITDYNFRNLPDLLPPDSLLLFNNTKVVKARLFFQRPSGSLIEIFCLEPVAPFSEMQLAMQQTGFCTWKCLIGNAKRWKEESLQITVPTQEGETLILTATKGERLADSFLAHFSWSPQHVPFAQILETFGNLPLPPYLNRAAEETDQQTYQTVYARQAGAVAAPTAGLHFTDEIFSQLQQRNIKTLEFTLHVGAGTFKPVKAQAMAEHPMHEEEIYVSASAIRQLLQHFPKPFIPVGTTSMRTLESLYWLGILVLNNPDILPNELHVPQWFAYENAQTSVTPSEALTGLLHYLDKQNLEHLRATTKILIAPGYQFKFTSGLITNFHQPESTLLLLVSALIGEDWRKVYAHALQQNYRFLSYGDSSLLLR